MRSSAKVVSSQTVKCRILVIDSEKRIYEALASELHTDGFLVDWVADPEVALELVISTEYALVLLDLDLTGMPGQEICQAIRNHCEKLPIILVSSRGSEADRIAGLFSGCDDYLVKPYSIFELTLRIRRRLQIALPAPVRKLQSDNVLRFGTIALNPDRREVIINDARIELTRLEFDVLELLMRNPERVVSRRELLQRVWGTTHQAYQNCVTVIVGRVRRKLEEAAAGQALLRTIRGVGFMLSRSVEP